MHQHIRFSVSPFPETEFNAINLNQSPDDILVNVRNNLTRLKIKNRKNLNEKNLKRFHGSQQRLYTPTKMK